MSIIGHMISVQLLTWFVGHLEWPVATSAVYSRPNIFRQDISLRLCNLSLYIIAATKRAIIFNSISINSVNEYLENNWGLVTIYKNKTPRYCTGSIPLFILSIDGIGLRRCRIQQWRGFWWLFGWHQIAVGQRTNPIYTITITRHFVVSHNITYRRPNYHTVTAGRLHVRR